MKKFCEEKYDGKCYRPRTIYWHCPCPGEKECVYIKRLNKLNKQSNTNKGVKDGV